MYFPHLDKIKTCTYPYVPYFIHPLFLVELSVKEVKKGIFMKHSKTQNQILFMIILIFLLKLFTLKNQHENRQ